MLNHIHSFDWNNIKILESNYNKKLISEMLYIKEQFNSQKLSFSIIRIFVCLIFFLIITSDDLLFVLSLINILNNILYSICFICTSTFALTRNLINTSLTHIFSIQNINVFTIHIVSPLHNLILDFYFN